MKTIHIYTDGACSGNPGPGGAAAVILMPDESSKRIAQGYRLTTNNRMELMAVILALKKLTYPSPVVKRGDKIILHTDSQLVYGCLTLNWRRNVNLDLWEEVDRELEKLQEHIGATVTFDKVKGHDGQQWNEVADKLAVAACTAIAPLDDEGYNPDPAPQRQDKEPEPGLFDNEDTRGGEDISANDVSDFLVREAQTPGGCTYRLLTNLFASHELSLERLATELTKHIS